MNLTEVLKKFMESYVRNNMNDTLPAQVVSYDHGTNRAIVQPLVMLGLEDGGKLSRARVVNVPVYRLGGGGFFIQVPIKEGDLGWLKATDRDYSLIMRDLQEDKPNTGRMHSFSDSVFFPDSLKYGASVDATSMVLQSEDGDTTVVIDQGKVTIKASSVVIDGNIEVSGTIKATGNVTAGIGPTAVGLMTHNHATHGASPTPGT